MLIKSLQLGGDIFKLGATLMRRRLVLVSLRKCDEAVLVLQKNLETETQQPTSVTGVKKYYWVM